MMFWLRSPFTVSSWGYLFPGPVTSPRYPPVKRTFGFPSHFPLGICHQMPGFRYTPSELWFTYVQLRLYHRSFGFSPVRLVLVTAWLFQFSLPVNLTRFGPHTSLITSVTRS